MNILKQSIVILFVIISFASCKKEIKPNDDLRELLSDKEFTLKGDSLQQLNAVLDKLDEKNEPLKKFVYHTYYEIQDSIDIVMPRIDSLESDEQEKFDIKKADLTIDVISKYHKKFNISEQEDGIIRYSFVLDPNVKKFCNEYIEEITNSEIQFEK